MGKAIQSKIWTVTAEEGHIESITINIDGRDYRKTLAKKAKKKVLEKLNELGKELNCTVSIGCFIRGNGLKYNLSCENIKKKTQVDKERYRTFQKEVEEILSKNEE